MSTTAAPNLPQVPVNDLLYDPDDVLTRNSPGMEPRHPTLKPTPSPPPSLPSSPASSAASPGNKGSNRRRKPRARLADDVLIRHLDGGRAPLGAYTCIEPSASESDDADDPDMREDSVSARGASPSGQWAGRRGDRGRLSKASGGGVGIHRMASSSPVEEDMGAFDMKSLESLAAGALAAAAETAPRQQPDAGPTPPVTEHDVVGGKAQPAPPASMAIYTQRTEPRQDERNGPLAMPSPYSPPGSYSSREPGTTTSSLKLDMRSPATSIHSSNHGEGLPPIQLNSPRYETNGQTLPSIRTQLGDLPQLGNNHAVGGGMRGSHHGFPGSPPASMPRLPSLHSLASPPLPPAEPYRDPLSPVHPLAAPVLSPTGYYYGQTNGLHRPHEYADNSPDAPGSNQSGSPPASGFDRMSTDGITIQTTGSYTCKVPGCTAPPFQTQYLLNSHANVHSSARPHYCPVPGCARGEGGKGFKRKNEMIRHGLVHDSPGYVCPFCPDRDHRYPRPDNLQR